MLSKLLLVLFVLSLFGVVSKGVGILSGVMFLYFALKSIDIEY